MVKFLVLFFSFQLLANVNSKSFFYKTGEKEFEAYLVYPNQKAKALKPAVLVVHDWLGLTEKTKKKTEEIAELGYIAMAIDVFGKNVRPKDPKEAGENTKQ